MIDLQSFLISQQKEFCFSCSNHLNFLFEDNFIHFIPGAWQEFSKNKDNVFKSQIDKHTNMASLSISRWQNRRVSPK